MRNMTVPLAAHRISALRKFDRPTVAIGVVDETGSTNADLLATLDLLPSATLLAAEVQTAGRGRAGRQWYSARGEALTFSLAWKFRLPVQSLVGLPLAVGVVIAEVLSQFGVDARLKWPNDVLRDGQKLAGILIETASSGRNDVWAVVGIGINIGVSERLGAQIGRTYANMPAAAIDRNSLLAALLDGLAEAFPQFEEFGFKAFITRWNALDAYAGQMVRIDDGGRVLYEGLIAGVDEIGRLLLDTDAGRMAVMAGDVSLRLQEG